MRLAVSGLEVNIRPLIVVSSSTNRYKAHWCEAPVSPYFISLNNCDYAISFYSLPELCIGSVDFLPARATDAYVALYTDV